MARLDQTRVKHWLDEGLTVPEIQRLHADELNEVVSQSAIYMFMTRNGIHRHARTDGVVPWEVAPEHLHNPWLRHLRVESRIRQGLDVSQDYRDRLDSFKAKLRELDGVVHYVADTDEGFFIVDRRPVDTDLIRNPLIGDDGRPRKPKGLRHRAG